MSSESPATAAPSQAETVFALRGVVDHGRAEALATRIRAAVRNGRTHIVVNAEPGAILASGNLVAFLVRAADHLRGRGGCLELRGDAAVLDQVRSLGILEQLSRVAAPAQASGVLP